MNLQPASFVTSILDSLNAGVVVLKNNQFLYTNTFANKVLSTDKLNIQIKNQWRFNGIIYPKPWIVHTSQYIFQVSVACASHKGSEVFVYTILDITREIDARNHLDILYDYLDSISDVGILTVDEDSRITYANKTSLQIDQLELNDILGKKFSSLYPEVISSPLLQSLDTGIPVWHKTMQFFDENHERQISSGYPFIRDGKIKGAIATLFTNDWINRMISNTSHMRAEFNSKRSGKTAKYVFDDILGSSPQMKSAKKIAIRVSNLSSSVLLYGETGTGKELFAQSIHNASSRNTKPFIAINCAAIPETLLESTLFGTEKGAYTGAVTTPGLIEECQDGTLFLDEINSMPINLQVKLLRVLQELQFRRVGGNTAKKMQCRIISACNIEPHKCIQDGTLRQDLYYRLSVIQINIPPLREHIEDIPLLVENAISNLSGLYGIYPSITGDALQLLKTYSWPGNIRELNHIIESVMVLLMDDGEEITPADLPEMFRQHLGSRKDAACIDLKGSLSDAEKENIIQTLKQNNWNVSKTASVLGYSRSNLQYRMKKFGIQKSQRMNY